jgi:hypothetical protein
MTALYSYLGSMPAPLPFRITLPSGFTRTDPGTFTQDEIAAAGYIGPIVPPGHNPETEYLAWVGGEYRVETLPPAEPEPRWQEFRAALRGMQDLQVLVATLAQVDPIGHLAIGVGLGQAAQGDTSTFTGVWAELLAAGLVTPAMAAAVAAMAVTFDLPAEFVAALAPAAEAGAEQEAES